MIQVYDQHVIQDDGCCMVQDIGVICDIGKTTVHKVLTEQLNMELIYVPTGCLGSSQRKTESY